MDSASLVTCLPSPNKSVLLFPGSPRSISPPGYNPCLEEANMFAGGSRPEGGALSRIKWFIDTDPGFLHQQTGTGGHASIFAGPYKWGVLGAVSPI